MRGARRRDGAPGGTPLPPGADSALSPEQAAQRARGLTLDGTVAWSRRGLDRARAEGLTTVECDLVLRDGVADPARFENGRWQYRIHASRICVVVVFRDDEAVVVDIWQKQR